MRAREAWTRWKKQIEQYETAKALGRAMAAAALQPGAVLEYDIGFGIMDMPGTWDGEYSPYRECRHDGSATYHASVTIPPNPGRAMESYFKERAKGVVG